MWYERKEEGKVYALPNYMKNFDDIEEELSSEMINEEEKKLEKLDIGLNEEGKNIFIPKQSRFLNTLILGTKGSGKTTGILPMFLEQDFNDKDCGATIIVSKNEIAYTLYALAKQYKRDVVILKPSISNEISNKFLWTNSYDYDYINENIINYKEAIKKKKIVIIDMEILKHKNDGLRAVAMLLLQLQLDMQETDITLKKEHYLYIDDANYYLPFLEFLLSYGDNYNIGITLFMKSRKQLIKNGKDYSTLIDSNVRNVLLLNALEKNDITYYKDRIYEYKQLTTFYNRNIYDILYEIVDNKGKRKCGIANYGSLTNLDFETLNNKAKSFRTKLLKEKRRELEKEMLNSIKYKLQEPDDEFYKEDEPIDFNEEETSQINELEKEIFENLTEEDLLNDNSNVDEPTPIDLSLFNEDIEVKDNSLEEEEVVENIKEHVNSIKKDFDKEEIEKKKKENIQKVIQIKEKGVKRIVSTNIFNKVNSDINYCEDDFEFSFD